jgi:hypothetical protein
MGTLLTGHHADDQVLNRNLLLLFSCFFVNRKHSWQGECQSTRLLEMLFSLEGCPLIASFLFIKDPSHIRRFFRENSAL